MFNLVPLIYEISPCHREIWTEVGD